MQDCDANCENHKGSQEVGPGGGGGGGSGRGVGGGGRFQVRLVPMLEQSIEKYTINSVLKISKTGTLFHCVPHKKYPFSLCSHK